jgi:hypothetical protein
MRMQEHAMSGTRCPGDHPHLTLDRPWTVLVVRNLVVQIFPWIAFADELAEMQAAARRIAVCVGLPVLVYEVDRRQPPPPPAGNPADAASRGWCLIDTIALCSAGAP